MGQLSGMPHLGGRSCAAHWHTLSHLSELLELPDGSSAKIVIADSAMTAGVNNRNTKLVYKSFCTAQTGASTESLQPRRLEVFVF